MNATVDQLKETLAGLPAPERAEIAHFLLASLEPVEEGAAEAWQVELRRRMDEIRSGRAVGKPVEEVLVRLRKIYP